MYKFKVNDLVYLPTLSTELCVLKEDDGNTDYPLSVVQLSDNRLLTTITTTGKVCKGYKVNNVFLASKKNHALLGQLFDLCFEEPKETTSLATIFKAGDRVYYPTYTSTICVLKDVPNNNTDYPLANYAYGSQAEIVTEAGKLVSRHSNPIIFHATKENRDKLSDLYNIEFEQP